MNGRSKRLDRALSVRPDKWLPPTAYKAWRRKLANQARGQRQTQEFLTRAYAERDRPAA
jgi:phage terminase small subunit